MLPENVDPVYSADSLLSLLTGSNSKLKIKKLKIQLNSTLLRKDPEFVFPSFLSLVLDLRIIMTKTPSGQVFLLLARLTSSIAGFPTEQGGKERQ